MNSIQLNLFGDILDFSDQNSSSQEAEHGTKSLGKNGPSTLGEIPPELLPDVADSRNTGTGTRESRRTGERNDSRPDGERITTKRSLGDSSPAIHPSDSGTLSGSVDRPGVEAQSISLFGKSVPITHFDSQAILNQYAQKFAGINEDGKTVGFTRAYRQSQGIPLWEDMSPSERKQEIFEYIKNDFHVAIEESANNPVNYLLDRALDPLDPLREVYRQILINAGATIENETIRLPDYLTKQLEYSQPKNSLPRPADTFRNDHTDDRGNYHITESDNIGAGGKVAKFEANYSAIILLKHLEQEKRYATPVEQSVLVKYTGWGGLSEAFKKDLEGSWLERQNSLKAALTPEEYSSASRSTLNAHFTDPDVVSAVWSAVIRMGYNGGPTLEPATGIGHFFGKRPAHLPIEMHGIELDSISGRLAQHLYQSADIKITGYEDIRMPENRYNLIISNVPFGDYKPYEEKRNQTPGIDNRYSIHDFYFLKSLHGVREGGMIAFVTSRYTMDKLDSEVREKIASKADFIGAIRLPNETFRQIADTEVVTDIVFLQKRPPDQEMSEQTKRFITTCPLSITDPEGQSATHSINQYYINHPEMVLGTHSLTGSMYSGNEYTVSPKGDLRDHLASVINNFPENVMSVMIDAKTQEFDDSMVKAVSHVDITALPSGSFIVGSDKRLYQKDIDSGEVILSRHYEKENHSDISRIIQMSSIRDCVKSAIDHYHSGQQIEVNSDLKQLNSRYDSFVKEFGFLNAKKNLLAFNNDPESSLLQSLEKWNPKTKTATKADIFNGITFVRKEAPTHVDSPVDAMVLSLSRYGRLNISYMESLTGNDSKALVEDLLSTGRIYQDPHDYLHNNRTTYLTADEYLSGNIREKVREAEVAAKLEPLAFSRNVYELTKVIPRDIEPQDISLRLNSPILGEEHVKDFVSDLLDLRKDRVHIVHVPITGKWEINADFRNNRNSTANVETYGTSRMPAVDIINALMNGKPVKVYSKSLEGEKPVLDQEATSAAELKAEAISNAFTQWLWKDEIRTDDITRRYNEVYNSHVERSFTHPERMANPQAEIWMHGCAFPHSLRSNQADSIWRVLQSSNTMLAHTVGSGKTLEVACSAMELRRLGLRNKSMVVCPDHMIGQWGAEFREAYPAAKLLIADDNNWNQENRRTFVNRIATGDWDAVLIRSESFKMIPMSEEYQTKFFEDKIAEYSEILDATDAANRKSRSVKDLEKAIEKYENKIKELTDAVRDEGVLPFDKLGIDHLFIDEADIFKNLEYYTQLQNVRGLGTPKGSERAIDMLMKLRYVQEAGGGITFATGTPISNTLVEAYTMQRFLQPEVLKANGLEAFDEWARQYAECVTQMELNNTGTGYSPVTRFSKIVNVPELVSSLRQAWDIQTAHNLESAGILVPGINLPRMTIINEAAPSTPLLQSYLKHLEERERDLSGKPEKGKDNVLSIMTDGRKAAIDMRFINPHLPDNPDSKLNLAVNIIHNVYTQYAAERYTCAVFFDKSRSFDSTGSIQFDGVADIKRKLIEKGVSPSEIGIVRDCKTFAQRQELFRRVRDGECRVIFGSTESMGAGTNFQKYLKAIVHVDAPWRPRDIEQQNGRGYRPGNTTGELLVYNLVTKGSLDTGLWNVLETKANSIRQVMDGSDKSTRQIEENYYGSVKELSIDNAIMKEAVELDHSLRKLKSQERAFNNEISNAHRRVGSLPREISKASEHCLKIKQDMDARHPEMKGDAFSIILNGKPYVKRQEAGDVIKSEASTLFLQARAAGRDIEKQIGSYAGFPVVMHSTIREGISIGRLSACGPTFRYSAEIRDDSNPVGICNAFHAQIYRGMEKMYADSQQTVANLKKSLEDYKLHAAATFPKTEELKTKDFRYTEVMAILKKQAEEQPKQEKNPHDIQWNNLSSLTRNEIRDAVRVFYDNVKEIQQPVEPPLPLKSGADIAAAVQKSHALLLPVKVVSTIDAAIAEGKLHPEATYTLICSAIDQVRNQHFSWKHENNPAGVHSAYVINSDSISRDDILIKPTVSDDKPVFEAFKVVDSNNLKYLGSEPSLIRMQKRIEAHVTCMKVREVVNETISLSNRVNKMQEKRADYGLEM